MQILGLVLCRGLRVTATVAVVALATVGVIDVMFRLGCRMADF